MHRYIYRYTHVVDCKLPWKWNSWISPIFWFYRVHPPLFRINPAKRLRVFQIFISGRPVLIHRRVNLGLIPRKREGAGAKQANNRRVFLLEVFCSQQRLALSLESYCSQFSRCWLRNTSKRKFADFFSSSARAPSLFPGVYPILTRRLIKTHRPDYRKNRGLLRLLAELTRK